MNHDICLICKKRNSKLCEACEEAKANINFEPIKEAHMIIVRKWAEGVFTNTDAMKFVYVNEDDRYNFYVKRVPTTGVYETHPRIKLRETLREQLKSWHIEATSRQLNQMNQFCEEFFFTHVDEWQSVYEKHQWLLENGQIYDLDTKTLRESTINDYWRHAIPRQIKKVNKKLVKWYTDSLKYVTEDWEVILSFFASIIQQIHLPYLLIFVGPPSYGKSPHLLFLPEMLGTTMADQVEFEKLGEIGGLKTIWDKIIGYDEDMSISYLKDSTIALMKKLYSKARRINVRLLWKSSFSITAVFNLLLGTNQASTLPSGVDENGFFKRIKMCLYDLIELEDDDSYVDKLYSDEVLDAMFNYLLTYPVKNYRADMGLKAFIAEAKLRWDESAYPMLHFIEENYISTFDPNIEIEQGQLLTDVAKFMSGKGIKIPKNLTGDITKIVKKMGGDKKRRSSGDVYIGIKSKTPLDLQNEYDNQLQASMNKLAEDVDNDRPNGIDKVVGFEIVDKKRR